MKKLIIILTAFFITLFAQSQDFTAVNGNIYFDKVLRKWDGFGFNYVETCQTRDYDKNPEDYGGFSILSGAQKDSVLDMVFGEAGLKVNLVKMFLDPFHQQEQDGQYNHRKTTKNMLEFVKGGAGIAKNRDEELTVITTLYGPPGYMTKQKHLRGRDFDPDYKEDLANYFIDWAKFLKSQQINVKYISLHNEGEGWYRWPQNGRDDEEHNNHDYNMFWPPELVVDFLTYLPVKLKTAGLSDIGVAPGETYSWDRFKDWGYAEAIADNPSALKNISLITSHGFLNWGFDHWNSEHTSAGNDIIRAKKPGIHAWVTSTSWSKMDADFGREIYSNIYESKINGLIPWAGIKRPGLWDGGDPNSTGAFLVNEDGSFDVLKGFYFYKQFTRAGQAGTSVVRTNIMSSAIKILAFKGNEKQKDSFIIINAGHKEAKVAITITGSDIREFDAYRTTDVDKTNENYAPIGRYLVKENSLVYVVPPKSVTTFFGK